MSEENVQVRRRRPCHPGKRTTKCTAKFQQLIACEFAVTFAVDIPDVELINVTCVDGS